MLCCTHCFGHWCPAAQKSTLDFFPSPLRQARVLQCAPAQEGCSWGNCWLHWVRLLLCSVGVAARVGTAGFRPGRRPTAQGRAGRPSVGVESGSAEIWTWRALAVSRGYVSVLSWGLLWWQGSAGSALSRDSSTPLRPLKPTGAASSWCVLGSGMCQFPLAWPTGAGVLVCLGAVPVYCTGGCKERAPWLAPFISSCGWLQVQRQLGDVLRGGIACLDHSRSPAMGELGAVVPTVCAPRCLLLLLSRVDGLLGASLP